MLFRQLVRNTVGTGHKWMCTLTTSASESLPKYCYPQNVVVDKTVTFRRGLTKDDLGHVNEEVLKILSLDNGAQWELNKAYVAKAVEAFARFPGDTGSSEVQIAVLTQKIKYLTTHMQTHKKDKNTLRGLIKAVEKRKKLMRYLKRDDFQRYKAVIEALGIRMTV